MRYYVSLSATVAFELTVSVCERLKASGLLDVMGLPINPNGFNELLDDPGRLAKVAWEMSDKTLSVEQFAALIDSEALVRVWDAVADSITESFREPMRSVVAALIDETIKRRNEMANQMLQVIHGVPSEPGDAFGSLPESLELIPDHSLFVSSTTWPEVASAAIGDVRVV
jgi:hypothetical protein